MSALLLEIAQESIELLQKAAQEADAFEQENGLLRQQVADLQKRASAPPVSRNFDPELLGKLAETLEEENLLVEGLTHQKLAQIIQEDPNRLTDITLRLICPMPVQGRAVKSAHTPRPSQESDKLVNFNGKMVIDHDGWLKALAK